MFNINDILVYDSHVIVRESLWPDGCVTQNVHSAASGGREYRFSFTGVVSSSYP